MMRFYTQQHRFYCGIDLHARLLAICILDQAGTIVLQKQIGADKQLLLETLAPFRPDVVIAEMEQALGIKPGDRVATFARTNRT